MSELLNKFQNFIIKHPKRMILFLVLWVAILNGYGLGSLEFVRHTEADRTLISWEMNENNNYLVPTLLGSQILTKPPLYYWSTAFFLKVFDSHSEGIARITSLVAGIILVAFSYYFWIQLTGKRRLSALAAFALSCSVLFYILGSLAEIDMIFGCFCALSLYAGFLVYERGGMKRIILFSLFITLAFLAKGPPVYFFCIGTFVLFAIRDFVFKEFPLQSIFKKLLNVFLGLVLAVVFLMLWLMPLGMEVGWSSLGSRLEEEVFHRVTNYSERDRGPFFYVGALLVNSLPWSIFLLIGAFHFFRRSTKKIQGISWYSELGGYFSHPEVRRLFNFSIVVVFSGFCMLSIAQGKSSRYCFPLIPFLINIAVVLSPITLKKVYYKKLLILFRLISATAIVLLLGLYIFGDIQGVLGFDWFMATLFVLVSCGIGLLGTSRGIWKNSIFIIGFLFFTSRIVQTHIFNPHRNATRSVKSMTQELVSFAESAGAKVYTVELFERWTVYYAKRLRFNIERLTPEIIQNTQSLEGRTFLLLDYDEEGWRYFQAKMYDDDVKIEKIFPHPSSSCFLISVPNKILPRLGVLSAFPTHPSVPFYKELESRKL